jgi:hypothetical protein
MWDRSGWIPRELRLRIQRESWRGDYRGTLEALELAIADRDDIDTPAGRRLVRAVHSIIEPLLETTA